MIFKVENMSCMHCVNKIADKLKAEKIKKFHIDLESKTVHIKKTKFTPEEIKQMILPIGYEFNLLEN